MVLLLRMCLNIHRPQETLLDELGLVEGPLFTPLLNVFPLFDNFIFYLFEGCLLIGFCHFLHTCSLNSSSKVTDSSWIENSGVYRRWRKKCLNLKPDSFTFSWIFSREKKELICRVLLPCGFCLFFCFCLGRFFFFKRKRELIYSWVCWELQRT